MHCLHQNPTNWMEVFTAIGTLGTVILTAILFFYERIKNYLQRPILQLGIHFNPPECHKTVVRVGDRISNAYWFRLFVSNNGKSTANDVEVTIDKVYKKIGDQWKVYSAFLPSSLKWTHIDQALLSGLIPGTVRNIDFGYIMDPKIRYAYPFENNPTLTNDMTENLLNVCISVKPWIGYNIIEPGEYKFQLTIGAKNCKPQKEQIILKFTKDWKEDEARMLNETITISK
jgi:hypothetical protein